MKMGRLPHESLTASADAAFHHPHGRKEHDDADPGTRLSSGQRHRISLGDIR